MPRRRIEIFCGVEHRRGGGGAWRLHRHRRARLDGREGVAVSAAEGLGPRQLEPGLVLDHELAIDDSHSQQDDTVPDNPALARFTAMIVLIFFGLRCGRAVLDERHVAMGIVMRFDDSPDGSAVYAHPLIQLAYRAVPRRRPFERGPVLRGSDDRPIIALNADDLRLD